MVFHEDSIWLLKISKTTNTVILQNTAHHVLWSSHNVLLAIRLHGDYLGHLETQKTFIDLSSLFHLMFMTLHYKVKLTKNRKLMKHPSI